MSTRDLWHPANARLPVTLLAIAGGLGFAPVLFMVGSTQRYLMDLWPCAAVLATIGLWQFFAGARRTIAFRAAIAVVFCWTIGLGMLMGFTGYYDHFRTWNGPLYECLGGPPPADRAP